MTKDIKKIIYDISKNAYKEAIEKTLIQLLDKNKDELTKQKNEKIYNKK